MRAPARAHFCVLAIACSNGNGNGVADAGAVADAVRADGMAALGPDASTGTGLSDAPSAGGCSITVSGDSASGITTQTMGCLGAAGEYDTTGTNLGAVTLGSTNPVVVVNFMGAPAVMTYTPANTVGGEVAYVQNVGTSWLACATCQPAQGTFSLALGSVDLTIPGMTNVYVVHGTLDATLPAAPGTGAKGTVTVHADF